MNSEISKLKKWRAVEIVKIFLLKLKTKLKIEEPESELFDLLVSLQGNPEVRFGIEVKSKSRFTSKINKHVDRFSNLRNQNKITFPIFIIKVDDEQEESVFDFLVFPSFKREKLLVRETFKFIALNDENFIKKLGVIFKWYQNIQNLWLTESESEIEQRSLSDDLIVLESKKFINQSFYAESVCAYLSMTDLSGIKGENSDKEDIGDLLKYVKIWKYLEHAISKAKTIKIVDYSNGIIISEVNYPFIFPTANSLILVSPINQDNNQSQLINYLSVIMTCLEILNVAIDNKLIIRGVITLDKVLMNREHGSVISPEIIQSKINVEKNQNDFSVVLSSLVKKEINKNLNEVHPTLLDYFLRFVRKTGNSELSINSAMILGNNEQKKIESLEKLNTILSSLENDERRAMLASFIETLENQNVLLEDRSIYE